MICEYCDDGEYQDGRVYGNDERGDEDERGDQSAMVGMGATARTAAARVATTVDSTTTAVTRLI